MTPTKRTIMDTKTVSHAVAKVTGLYRGRYSGLEPLTVNTPLTLDEVRRNPISTGWT